MKHIRRPNLDSGLTLIELLIVTLIMPIIVGAIGYAIYSAFAVQNTVGASVSSSSGLQELSSVFYKDAQSAIKITTSSSAPQCGTGTQLLGFEWNQNGNTSTYDTVVSYSLQPTGKTYSLVRNYCNFGPNATPTSATAISGDVSPNQAPPILTPSYLNNTAATGWVSANGVSNVDFRIHEVGSSFVYNLDSTPQLSSSSIPASPPGVPTGVSAVASSGFAVVSWSAPLSNGGSAISGYMVTATDTTKSTNGGQGCAASSLTCTVTGLYNGDTYTFTVVAINGAGSSNPSAPSSPVEPIGPPPAPTGATAMAGISDASVSWVASASDGGSTITGYTVTSSGGQTCATPSTTCTVTGLTNGNSYTFTVTATNGVGTSSASAPSNSVTLPTVPSAPTGVTATAGDTRVTVSWTAPSNNGGMTITGYTVISSGGQTCTTTGGLTCTVAGLTDGTSYTFTVTATNDVGTSVASPPSSSVTPSTITIDFLYSGSPQSWVVPAGVHSITVTAYGAQGGDFNSGGYYGLGGKVTGVIGVSPGQIVDFMVGGAGAPGNQATAAAGGWGWNYGGGSGGVNTYSSGYSCSGGGGGASSVVIGSTTVLIAGGGGGGTLGGYGGTGGGLSGATAGGDTTYGGGGGTQTTDGAGGTSVDGSNVGMSGSAGMGGNGGNGASSSTNQIYTGAGGGGGYYGGGGGATGPYASAYSGAGGGGSSLVPAGGTTTAGVNSGNGSVTITY